MHFPSSGDQNVTVQASGETGVTESLVQKFPAWHTRGDLFGLLARWQCVSKRQRDNRTVHLRVLRKVTHETPPPHLTSSPNREGTQETRLEAIGSLHRVVCLCARSNGHVCTWITTVLAQQIDTTQHQIRILCVVVFLAIDTLVCALRCNANRFAEVVKLRNPATERICRPPQNAPSLWKM